MHCISRVAQIRLLDLDRCFRCLDPGFLGWVRLSSLQLHNMEQIGKDSLVQLVGTAVGDNTSLPDPTCYDLPSALTFFLPLFCLCIEEKTASESEISREISIYTSVMLQCVFLFTVWFFCFAMMCLQTMSLEQDEPGMRPQLSLQATLFNFYERSPEEMVMWWYG